MPLTELQTRSLGAMQRFIAKTKFVDGCVIWKELKGGEGYGRFKVGGRMYRAHRLSYAWANNADIPPGMYICHSCDNPACVSPEHLWLGTPRDNVQDAIKKGRHRHPLSSKTRNRKRALNSIQINEIRNTKRKHGLLDELSSNYGVSRRTIRMARHSKYRG